MNIKPRRRLPPAPHGRLPNWAIALMAAATGVAAYIAHALN